MLVKFDPDSVESCKTLILELDKQNGMIQREYKNLQVMLKSFYEARKKLFKESISEPDNSNSNG